MKPIMSFWSEPYIRSKHNKWFNADSFSLSWILSVAAVTKSYGKPHLYTDEIGKHFLVDRLGLSFASIDLSLNELRGKNPLMFSLGRTYAIGVQKESFVHVDYDAYPFSPIPQELLTNGVFWEREIFVDVSKASTPMRLDLFGGLKGLPEWWAAGISNKQAKFYKNGIIAGSNIEYFSRLSQSIFDVVNSNTDNQFAEIDLLCKKDPSARTPFFVPQYILSEYLPYALAKHMNITPRFMISGNGTAASRFTHIHGRKNEQSEIYGRLVRRLVTDYPESSELLDRLQITKFKQIPKVSVIVMPNESSSVYDSVLRALIPRKIAPDEVLVSSYKLGVTDRQLLSKIDGVRMIPEGTSYLGSLEAAFRRTSGQVIIILDGHVRLPKQYIEKFLAGFIEYPNSVFCTASSDFSDKTNHISYGGLEDQTGIRPDLSTTTSEVFDMPKVQSLFGGAIALSNEAMHALFDPTNKVDSHSNISRHLEKKNYELRCIKSLLVSHNFKREASYIAP